MILECIGGDDAAKEAQGVRIERSVPGGVVGSDHVHVSKIDWDWIGSTAKSHHSTASTVGLG